MNFSLTANGEWTNDDAAYITGEPFFSVYIKECRSHFDKSLCRYHVVADALNVNNSRIPFTLKSFKFKADAEDFAAKLIHLLNGDD